MIRHITNMARLLGIARTLARHDATFVLAPLGPVGRLAKLAGIGARRNTSGRPGERLVRALSELGPTFIKFGQALSTRRDMFGEELAADLAALQDRLPPVAFDRMEKVIEREFGQPVSQVFATIDPDAVAAASIAQVHFATTPDGRDVAVKILRPGVEQAFAKNLDLLRWLAAVVHATQPALRRLKPVEVIETFAATTRFEMDLRLEAAAASEIAENFADDPSFRVPEIDWDRTRTTVLTMERVGGARVDDRAAVEALGLDPTEVVRTAASVFFRMVFEHGFFHADMHPGNLFVAPDGSLIAVDFGIMGRVDEATQRFLGEMLISFLGKNYRRVAEVHFEAGYVTADQDVHMFTQAIRSIAEPIMGKPMSEISVAELFGHLFAVTEQFSMQTQPKLLLLQKSMMLTEGVGRSLAPEANMWELSSPLIERWIRERMGPEARAVNAARAGLHLLETVPRIAARLDKITADIDRDGVRVYHPSTPRRAYWLPVLAVALAAAALVVALLD